MMQDNETAGSALVRLRWIILLLPGLILGAGGCTPLPFWQQNQQNARFEFALIGDAPYSISDATNAFPNLVRELNRTRLAFVVHDGDIKGGSDPCTDEILLNRFRLYQTVRHPFILVFGDNEWTDCAKNSIRDKGGPVFDPEERLRRLREIFASDQVSLGQRTLRLCRQSQTPEFAPFRENVRWVYGHVLFVGLNMPGTANNFGQAEFVERNQANLAWLREAFALAKRERHRGIMIVIQANPHFDLKPSDPARAGFNEFLEVLETETIAFRKPVVLVHGDTHYFRIDKPLVGSRSRRRVENFTRVETFGDPDNHWIRARVDWRDPDVFSFRPEIVASNLVNHAP